ncbi:MAG TPA: class I adenylate-forming enzyme family protein [Burkholderiales bacterium]|nr:class I adenylate-forming enzyme family protein [Burkholderiales bacterium]
MPHARLDNLGFFFSATARRFADRMALVDLWGNTERRYTYGELDRRTDAAAALLQSLGARPGERIALLVGNRCEYIEAFFGAMRAGLVVVPLNVGQAEANIEFMVRDSGSTGMILDPGACPAGLDIAERVGLRHRVIMDQPPRPGWVAYQPATGALYDAAVSPDGIAFQPYTAGSTGKPKGARLTHAGMLWSIESTQEHWPTDEAEIGLVAVPLFHKNAMRGTIKPNFYAGAKVVLMPRFEPRAFLTTLARERATFCGGVPAIFTLTLPHADLIRSLDFSALKLISIGSAVVPDELVERLEALFPSAKVKESYGLTEGGGPLRAPLDGRAVPRGSSGVAAPGYEVKLVEGELLTRSPCVTAGYHNRPDLTRERIVDGWLRTGDLFRVDDEGFYYFRGRVDDMFSCGGENIYPREVESLLLTHPDVIDVCVVPIPHDVKGLAPAAMVVLRPQARVSTEDLTRFTLANGPAYAHPRRIHVVDEIPLTAAGKPDKARVRSALTG